MNRVQEIVEKLAEFPSRHTLSVYNRPSCEWVAKEFGKLAGIEVEIMPYIAPKGPRIPDDREVFQVVATLKGKSERTVMIGGHLDSLNLEGTAGPSDVAKVVANRAPGANDDASGIAVTIACAEALCQLPQLECTVQFVAFTGEEQGLHGSRALAQRCKERGIPVEAVLSNDTVGSPENLNGQRDTKRIRVFSEEGSSRELARLIEWISRSHKGVHPKLVFRKDRFRRGGDHTPFNEAGFPAVRFVEVHEEYAWQHTHDDVPEHMDFDYLGEVAKLNELCLRSLAQSHSAPRRVRVKLDQSHDTTITWEPTSSSEHLVYWRETTEAFWHEAVPAGKESQAVLKKINKDDHVFAVGVAGGIPVIAE